MATVLAAFAFALVAPIASHAGTYVVNSCALPDGSPAPTDGWTFQWNEVGISSWGSTCLSASAPERALKAWINGAAPAGTYARWTFTAPANTTLQGYVLYRHELASGGNGTDRDVLYFDDAHGTTPQDGCLVTVQGCTERGSADPSARLSPANALAHDGLSLHTVTVSAGCDVRVPPATSCPPGPGGVVSIYAARMRLLDALAPTFDAAPRGTLVEAAEPVDKVQTVSVSAHDAGGGLRRAALVVDGEPVVWAKPDADAPTCSEPYVAAVPCPLAGSFTIAFDTRAIANGPHRVKLVVGDAAGNSATTAESNVTVKNLGAPNGAGATRLAALTVRVAGSRAAAPLQARVAFGHSARLTGKLVDAAGAPIAGAGLEVAYRVLRPGSPWHSQGPITTDAQGAWSLIVPRGSSREVRIGYRAFSYDETVSRELVARVDVTAQVRLSVTPRHVGRHGTIRFRGRLGGGPGQADTQVALYAVDARGRSRVPVAVLPCDENGRFTWAYRFSRTPGPTTYRFEAVLRRQAGYPYSAAQSPRVAVRVG